MDPSCPIPGRITSGLKRVEYDPEVAKTMLKEAGYILRRMRRDIVRKKDEVALRFEMAYPDDDHHQAIAEMIRTNWTRIGRRSFS